MFSNSQGKAIRNEAGLLRKHTASLLGRGKGQPSPPRQSRPRQEPSEEPADRLAVTSVVQIAYHLDRQIASISPILRCLHNVPELGSSFRMRKLSERLRPGDLADLITGRNESREMHFWTPASLCAQCHDHLQLCTLLLKPRKHTLSRSPLTGSDNRELPPRLSVPLRGGCPTLFQQAEMTFLAFHS